MEVRNTIDIAGVPVDFVTMAEAVNIVQGFIAGENAHAVYTPNAEIMMEAQRDLELNTILRNADLLIADGAGVVLASKLLGTPLPEKVSGIDLVKNTLKLTTQKSLSLFLLGGKPGVAEIAGANMVRDYPGVTISGCRDGFFSPEEDQKIVEQINQAQPDILLVALGAPKQEKWIHKHRPELKAKVCIGVGGTLDIFAGTAKLAPEFMRKRGFEWLYRLYREPRRYKRMLDLPRFMTLVILKRLGIK